MKCDRILTAALWLPSLVLWPSLGFAQIQLPSVGQAATAPPGLTEKAAGARSLLQPVVSGFTINPAFREQARDFYNGIYPTSENVPEDSTADQSSCFAGTNSTAFEQAVLKRINWFRAMAGDPATVRLDPQDSAYAQEMALLISVNNQLDHNATTMSNWTCFSTDLAGTKYAGGNQGLGFNGPDCITGFIIDNGFGNAEVGHRRWILYPPEIVMGTGDVPFESTNNAANSTWVFDPRSFGARPATRQPFVSWPPPGYVTPDLVSPYWSFSLSNANFSAATVAMTSNGAPVSASLLGVTNGFGDNTLVWLPLGLNGNSTFPFSGTDTVYSVTVSNIGVVINNQSTNVGFAYTVTLFDPSVRGTDYIAPVISGPAQPLVNAPTTFSCAAINDANVSGYEWITAQLEPGNLVDDASNGLVNFTISPVPNYPVITTQPFEPGNWFNLEHYDTNLAPQYLQLDEVLYLATNTSLSFNSILGFATTNEVARVQLSTNGGISWQDVFTEAGDGSYQTSSTHYSFSLSNYAGQTALLRFNYDYLGGEAYNGGSPLGWYFTGIVLSNVQQLFNQTTNSPVFSTTNLAFQTWTEDAGHDLTNNAGLMTYFTMLPPPDPPIITNAYNGEGQCIHLTHDIAAPQSIQFNTPLYPTNNTTVTFVSDLGCAETNEVARVQVCTDGLNWEDIYAEPGTGGCPDSFSFATNTISLAGYSGQELLLRFLYDFDPPYNYFVGNDPFLGWEISRVVVTNAGQQVVVTTNTPLTTNFTFTATQTGSYLLQVVPLISTQFPVDPGPVKAITVVSNAAPVLLMSSPIITNGQVMLNFTLTSGTATSFHLLQAFQVTGPWATNTTATFTTNVPGSSYRFTTTNGPGARFYRVRTP